MRPILPISPILRISNKLCLDQLRIRSYCTSLRAPILLPVKQQLKSPLIDKLNDYKLLCKHRLSFMVATTAISGSIFADASDVQAAVSSFLGTLLCAFSASAANQLIESPYDRLMERTRDRPIPAQRISPFASFTFSIFSGLIGSSLLYSTCGYVPSVLALSNILIYAFIYTPLKRISHHNTIVGAIVGAIPPLIGWSATGASILDTKACILATLLFLWQFPHFISLSFKYKNDYARAGYQMHIVSAPLLAMRLSTLSAISLLTLSIYLSGHFFTGHFFKISSFVLNFVLLTLSLMFHSKPSVPSSTNLFLYMLIYLPSMLALLILSNCME